MDYNAWFKNKEDVKRLAGEIRSSTVGNINIMEVCGTHTMAIAAAGIKQVLPGNIRLVSGPGCPVCVTPAERIDDVCKLSADKNVIIATYGDMLRVPGTSKKVSLEKRRMEGSDIRIVYSSIDALNIAEENKGKEVVFIGIGFETTAPASAAVINAAHERGIKNFSVFSMHKRVEPALKSLLEMDDINIDALLLPGHVAVILGEDGFGFLSEYKIPAVISGFEPIDILKSISMLVKQIECNDAKVENEYIRLVSRVGNNAAKDALNEVFEPCNDSWRGLGFIAFSGLKISKKYKDYDAVFKFGIELTQKNENSNCLCGDIIKGIIEPEECPMFGVSCTPYSPEGPCMVSTEGACAAAFKYR